MRLLGQQVFRKAERSRKKASDVEKWRKLNDSTIRFDGIIEVEYSKFRKLLKETPNFKTFIINSAGGSTKEALTIAIMILPYRVHVIVDGYGGFSCANCFFPAGFMKEIKNGWSGYHGNLRGLFEFETPEQRKAQLRVLMAQNGIEIDDRELDCIAAEEEEKFLAEVEV